MSLRQNVRSSIVVCLLASPTAWAQQEPADPSLVGEWSPLQDTKLTNPGSGEPTDAMTVIHAILLHTGDVLCIDFLTSHPEIGHPQRVNRPDVILFNPSNEQFDLVWESGTGLPPNNHELYCSGHTILSNGMLLIQGGSQDQQHGVEKTTVYDPLAGPVGSFIAAPSEFWCLNEDNCPGSEVFTRRWYPTLTQLSATQVLNTDGWVGTLGADGNGNIPAILNVGDPDPANWTWEPLYDAEYCSLPYLEDQCNPGAPNQFDLDLYPFMFLLSSGKVLMAGSQYLSTDPNNAPDFANSRLLSVGLGQWDGAFQASSTILGGSAAMFAQDKVLKAGGATSAHNSGCEHSPPTAAAYFIDMSQPNPAWTQTSDMYHPRINHGLVNLPNGQVLAVGGSKDPDDSCAAAGGALEPEMWNPLTGNWTRMAPMAVTRTQHAVELLLPSGAVFVAGGQYGDGSGNQTTYQVFKPPYFFNGPRPSITLLPPVVHYNTGFNVVTPEAANITAVRLIRPGAVTHHFDQSARMIELEFTFNPANPTRIRVSAPAHANIAPPGYYMLFVAAGQNGNTPSEGKFIQLQP